MSEIMPRRRKPTDDESVEHMLDPARKFVGDDAPTTTEEEAVIAERAKQLPRPTQEDIREIARRLARRGS